MVPAVLIVAMMVPEDLAVLVGATPHKLVL
jgi:hypothetical protein